MEANSSQTKFLYTITPQRLHQYEMEPVYFSPPRIVAYHERNYDTITAAKRINYFKEPSSAQYPIDLNVDFGRYVRHKSLKYPAKLESSLKYDMCAAAKNDVNENVEKTKVFTRCGTLEQLMCLYYVNYEDVLRIRVSRYNNNLYIVREEDEDFSNELRPVETHHIKLQKIVFTDKPNGQSKITDSYDENIKLIGVFRTNFEKYDMIYSGVVNGIIRNEEITDFDDLITLNTCRFVLVKQMWERVKNNDNRFLKIWLQSYLTNVRDVFIGYKIEPGIIYDPITYIPAQNLVKNRFWKPEICTGVLYDFLQNVERAMSSVNCLNTVYVFEYNRKVNLFTYKVFKGKTNRSFISEDYIKFCEQ